MDQDGDGLSQSRESALGLNDTAVDSNGDGIPDAALVTYDSVGPGPQYHEDVAGLFNRFHPEHRDAAAAVANVYEDQRLTGGVLGAVRMLDGIAGNSSNATAAILAEDVLSDAEINGTERRNLKLLDGADPGQIRQVAYEESMADSDWGNDDLSNALAAKYDDINATKTYPVEFVNSLKLADQRYEQYADTIVESILGDDAITDFEQRQLGLWIRAPDRYRTAVIVNDSPLHAFEISTDLSYSSH